MSDPFWATLGISVIVWMVIVSIGGVDPILGLVFWAAGIGIIGTVDIWRSNWFGDC